MIRATETTTDTHIISILEVVQVKTITYRNINVTSGRNDVNYNATSRLSTSVAADLEL